ncbi:MAG: hypothetical protein H7Y11_03410, partial [Armatimonadetes bacterium]|nr:hypothetical protein [Anaerolineae bacterium]
FAKNRSRPHNPAKLPLDFIQCGAYHLREAFAAQPIKVGVVNTLAFKIEDFVEALQRQLTRSFDFKIEVIRERKVRVLSLENVEAALRVMEKEQPDLILAFLPDATPTQPDTADLPAFVKSLSLGRGIPAHVLAQTTLDDPDAMPGIIMAILARTGNTPFALADPLEFADYVVGLDLVRQRSKTALSRVTAIARIYRADGAFVRYAVRNAELSSDAPPYVLLRDVFPQRDFAGKRVVLHHEGRMTDALRQAMTGWAQAIQATFYPVELIRKGAPRLYAFADNRVQAPPWGSTLQLNAHEGFAVLAFDDDGSDGERDTRAKVAATPTPQPLHIVAGGITLAQALRSLQLWTLLYYGVADAPRLPVTLYGAGELAYWLRKGGQISTLEGEAPFWL